uniref:Uncharacterized protein n=1 Tax=Oryzias latipes TaxID=8090 RepID=A0A3P9JUF3_ORYLA
GPYLPVSLCTPAVGCLRFQVGSRQSEVASVISKLASRHRTTGRVFDRPRSGAQPVTDHNHDQNLRTSDLRHLQARLPDVRGTRWTQDHVTWTMQQWSCSLLKNVGLPYTEMMVVSGDGESEVSNNPRLKWSLRLALVEEEDTTLCQNVSLVFFMSCKKVWVFL